MPKTNQYDARLIYSASEGDANMLWATRFFAPDPFIFIQKRGKRYLVMNDLEIDRAKSEASVDKVLPYTEYVRRKQKEGIAFPTAADVLSEVFRDLKIKTVEVPGTFPVGLADHVWSIGELLDVALAVGPRRPVDTPSNRRRRFRVIEGGQS